MSHVRVFPVTSLFVLGWACAVRVIVCAIGNAKLFVLQRLVFHRFHLAPSGSRILCTHEIPSAVGVPGDGQTGGQRHFFFLPVLDFVTRVCWLFDLLLATFFLSERAHVQLTQL